MKRLIVAVGLTAFVTGLAYAQDSKQAEDPKDQDPLVMYEKERARDRERADRDYQRTLKRTNQGLPAQQPQDPWANMRGPAENTGTNTKR